MSEENTDQQTVSDAVTEPVAEPPEPQPGGPRSAGEVVSDGATSTVGRDLPPDLNPVANQLPETATPEDTDTEATKGNPEPPPEEESPA